MVVDVSPAGGGEELVTVDEVTASDVTGALVVAWSEVLEAGAAEVDDVDDSGEVGLDMDEEGAAGEVVDVDFEGGGPLALLCLWPHPPTRVAKSTSARTAAARLPNGELRRCAGPGRFPPAPSAATDSARDDRKAPAGGYPALGAALVPTGASRERSAPKVRPALTHVVGPTELTAAPIQPVPASRPPYFQRPSSRPGLTRTPVRALTARPPSTVRPSPFAWVAIISMGVGRHQIWPARLTDLLFILPALPR
jgi:hypothetical protein